MSDVLHTVTDLLEQVTDLPTDQIGPQSRFADLTSWTSLAALRLLTTVEDHFGLSLDLRSYLNAQRVEDLVRLIDDQLALAPEGAA